MEETEEEWMQTGGETSARIFYQIINYNKILPKDNITNEIDINNYINELPGLIWNGGP